MEALMSQFTFLSNQSIRDKSFDPSTIDDLMRLFELEAYNSWAASELDLRRETEESERAVEEAEAELETAMEAAMREFAEFEAEMDRLCEAEMEGLVSPAERARRMGNFMERSAAIASKKYVEAAIGSATASMRAAWKGLSAGKAHTMRVVCG